MINRIMMIIILLLIIFFLFLAFQFGNKINAAEVTLAWDSTGEEIDGYRLFQRFKDQQYNYSQWIDNQLITATTYTVKNLLPGKEYCFVCRAVKGNDQSGDSNEVCYIVPLLPSQPTGIDLEP